MAKTSTFDMRVRGQLIMLTAAFLLGMGVNLTGLPSEVSGTAKTATSIFLGLHAFIALGLLIGAALTVRQARQFGTDYIQKAWIAATLVVLTIISGVLTIGLDSNWWSYAMAVGFIASFVIYGRLYLQVFISHHNSK
ncbi:MAG TPA: hypothetical protein VLF60_05720 [Candidatus Saccharimonadales bacterium]|nr:hypothetical protein [Candidatus Saccharimonadales bacterium]